MFNKEAMSGVVATALILVVAVVATVGFQNWFGDYQSQVLSDTEQKSSSSNSLKIQGVFNDELYLYSGGDSNLSNLKITSSNGVEMCSFSDSGVEVSNAGLIGWWKLDDDSATIKDYSGNGNDGKLYGNTRLLLDFDDGTATDRTSYGNNGSLINEANCSQSGISGQSCIFDGVDDYIDFSNETLNYNLSRGTISLWFNSNAILNESNAKLSLFQKGQNIGLYHNHESGNSGSLIFNFWNGTSWNYISSQTNSFNLNTWFNVIGVWENNFFKFYLNGVLENTTFVGEGLVGNNIYEMKIGSSYSGTWPFNGSIDEFAIYGKALTDEEVKDLFNSQKAKFIEFKDSKLDKAVEFDGVDDHISLGINGIADPQNNLNGTIITFLKGNLGSVYSEQELTPSSTFILSTQNNNINIHNGIGFDSTSILSSTNSNWHSLGGIWNLTDLSLILNNEIQNSISYSGSTQLFRLPIIGAHYSGSSMVKFFRGEIDEVRIYNRTLSQEEISKIYWDFLSSNEIGINRIDLSSCSLNKGEKYNVVAFTDSQKAESYFIAK